MEQLQEIGLYLNDLNKFDGSAEILVTELQHSDQLTVALNAVNSNFIVLKFISFWMFTIIFYKKQRAFFEKLQEARFELNAWKKKGKNLLYSMLPAKIAKQIENGAQPNTICEVNNRNYYITVYLFTWFSIILLKTYDEVTIMFAHTADFKSIITDSNIEPVQVIDFINAAVSLYDKVVSSYDKILKIETKADGSYMVVSGIDSDASSCSKTSDSHSFGVTLFF
jgi:guanylate cyclase